MNLFSERPFRHPIYVLAALILVIVASCRGKPQLPSQPDKGSHIIMIGNNLCARMLLFGHFETEMHLRFPNKQLYIRNLCDGGNTPGFRPHAGRKDPWAFPGAAEFHPDFTRNSASEGHFGSSDEWLTNLRADHILAFFGYSESFRGKEGLDLFKAELVAFVDHTLSQTYNGRSAPQLTLISPIAYENLSENHDLPDGSDHNQHLKLYSEAMRAVAAQKGISFVDLFTPSRSWYSTLQPLTIDGFQLNDHGNQKVAEWIVRTLYGDSKGDQQRRSRLHHAVMDKNWYWQNDYKIPNGVHVFGRRYEPFGPNNYPFELIKIREMTAIRDTAIWKTLQNIPYDIESADAATSQIPEVRTNFDSEEKGALTYSYGQEALDQLHIPPGYKVELFASEKEFPELANPVQLSFDNKGRLWVATMPSYPHYKPGDPCPDDKLIILEDENKDGKADKQTIFAKDLHMPIGFELAPEGVYVSQGSHLKLFVDSDGDDRADKVEILLSGFDDHDTHHAISAFSADPSGAIYMGEGVFLHTNVETAYGTVRATNGGFYRYSPQRRELERTAQLSIPNPWGIAFDEWGQNFYLETSGPALSWMMPGSIRPVYGRFSPKSGDLLENEHKVRPTSGLEFVSSRHFPDEVQGDVILGNTIGFLGIKQHAIADAGTGYKTSFRQDLIWSDDHNFRPVDMEFAPDGSLYVVDWHNVLIGHMQHNARDPLRDHVHGRIYRITYPSRPLVEPPVIAGASVPQLLDHLKLPEYRARYRTRRELRGRNADEVMPALTSWITALDSSDPRFEHHLLEALWVSWGMNEVDTALLERLTQSSDYRIRSAACRVIRYNYDRIKAAYTLLSQLAGDPHGRVRLEAIVTASWLDRQTGLKILQIAEKEPLDDWMLESFYAAESILKGEFIEDQLTETPAPDWLDEETASVFEWGQEIYLRDGHCGTCHQADGKGLKAAGFPPLAGSEWVTGDIQRLIKLTLKGLHGPIVVNGQEYPGQVPMTGFERLLEDEEIAAVLTYVRAAFDNKASAVSEVQVSTVRQQVKEKQGFYTPRELIRR